MPVLLLWAFPAVIVVGGAGYYLMAIAEIMGAALALAIPTEMPPSITFVSYVTNMDAAGAAAVPLHPAKLRRG